MREIGDKVVIKSTGFFGTIVNISTEAKWGSNWRVTGKPVKGRKQFVIRVYGNSPDPINFWLHKEDFLPYVEPNDVLKKIICPNSK